MIPSPDATPQFLGLTPDQAEVQIRLLDFEVGFVFSAEGNLMLARQGAQHAIYWSDEDCEMMTQANVIHNHPSGDSFSLDDVEMAVDCDVASIRVVTPDSKYTLLPPAEGWPAFDDIAQAVEWRIPQVQEDIDAGTIDAGSFMHEIWARVAGGLDLTYTADEVVE